jgi:hypothetical protein
MKKVMLTIIVIFSGFSVFSQVITGNAAKSQKELYDDYMHKSKTNKTIGWVLAGTGSALAIGGVIAATKEVTENVLNPQPRLNDTDDVLLGAGLVCAVASIPFFISAGKNRRRATLALSTQPLTLGYYRTQNKTFPSAGLSIRF